MAILSSSLLNLLEDSNRTWAWLVLVATGAGLGCIITFLLAAFSVWWYYGSLSPSLWEAADRRRRLPQLIVLVRHAESAANADKRLWKLLPDNLLGITVKGKEQARAIGAKVEALLNEYDATRVHLVVSPFERTLQTAANLRPPLERRIVRTTIDSRIREQEMGNLQGEEFGTYRQEQKRVGRFWYRFPTGESGADVCDRVASWWFESVLTVNTRIGFEPVDAMVVVTHGLTIRFILMQLFGWSPTTFHSVWNAENCDMYVLRKDMSKPGKAPYVLDTTRGVLPRSSIDVQVTFKATKTAQSPCTLQLQNYLSVPPPRTTRIKLVKHMLAQQHPDVIKNADDIATVCFMPFVEGGIVAGRSTSGVASQQSSIEDAEDNKDGSEKEDSNIGSCPCEDGKHDSNDESDDDDELADLKKHVDPNDHEDASIHRHAKREMSLRYPCIQLPNFSPSKWDLGD